MGYLMPKFVFTVIWFQVFLCNTKNFKQSIWFIDGVLIGITDLDHCGPGSNGTKEPHHLMLFHIIPKTSLFKGYLTSTGDTVSEF